MEKLCVILTLLPIFLLGSSLTYASSEKESTLAIIKPDGLLGNYTDKIKMIIMESGFTISREKVVQLDEENVTLFYAEHRGRSFFPNLVKYMTSGPVYVMVLEKVNAISDWRALIGPTDARKAKVSHPGSIRAMCGLDLERNCVHGSDSPPSAALEILFFFGEILPGGDIAKHDEL
ncbi:nucleoside diphosphate kinase family protein [Tasmannia lanceolata]|uniref:nucleoside diphosphate kinase family protein n=1 Tax=Tasmannia lanceolata TaxID=3420 RepID=UPI004062A37A